MSVRCTGRAWRLLQAALQGLTAAVLAAWLLAHLKEGPAAPGAAVVLHAAVACGLGLLAAGLSWRVLHHSPVQLAWDGQAWQLDDAEVHVALALSGASFVLLKLRTNNGTRWLGLGSREAGAAWHALRVALFAHARPAAGQGDTLGQGA